jgi:3-oxoacyl-[acyl-carrier protein] reductase
MELKDKVVVITGGASGIGLAMAQRFAAEGSKVVIADVKGVDEAAAGIREAGGQAAGVVCDVRDEASVAAAMKFATDTWGGIDVAIANAGILRDGLLLRVDKATGKVADRMSVKQWQDVIDVNLTGVFLTGREAAAAMIDGKRRGLLILLSSISKEGNFGQTNYSASKAGVIAMTVAWSRELARYGIRTAAIAPGFIETPMVMKDMKPEALEKFKQIIPIGRLGKPEEIAETAVFIAKCDLVTGVCIEATGGMRL